MNQITREFVHLFNEEEDFYECHELFELAWKQSNDPVDKLFYKALVQVATAQFKLKKGMLRGVRKLYQYSMPSLKSIPDVCQDVDIRKLREDFLYQVQSLPAADSIMKGEYERLGLRILKLNVVIQDRQ